MLMGKCFELDSEKEACIWIPNTSTLGRCFTHGWNFTELQGKAEFCPWTPCFDAPKWLSANVVKVLPFHSSLWSCPAARTALFTNSWVCLYLLISIRVGTTTKKDLNVSEPICLKTPILTQFLLALLNMHWEKTFFSFGWGLGDKIFWWTWNWILPDVLYKNWDPTPPWGSLQ